MQQLNTKSGELLEPSKEPQLHSEENLSEKKLIAARVEVEI